MGPHPPRIFSVGTFSFDRSELHACICASALGVSFDAKAFVLCSRSAALVHVRLEVCVTLIVSSPVLSSLVCAFSVFLNSGREASLYDETVPILTGTKLLMEWSL